MLFFNIDTRKQEFYVGEFYRKNILIRMLRYNVIIILRCLVKNQNLEQAVGVTIIGLVREENIMIHNKNKNIG